MAEIKNKKLTLEVVHASIPKKLRNNITQETIDIVNKLARDPDYGPEFTESFITYTSILSGPEKFSVRMYLDAVKFVSLTAMGISQARSYVKVFPQRLQARLDRGETIEDIGGEASRFNATVLVNKIRQQAMVPLHLVNQGTTQLAINTLTKLMLTARSDLAKVSAATALLKELRPPEVQQIEMQVGLSDAILEVHKRQTDKLVEIAENQKKMLAAGHSIEDVQRLNISVTEAEVEIDV